MNLECTLLWASIVVAVSNTAIAANSCFISISPYVWDRCGCCRSYLGRLNIRHGGSSRYCQLPVANCQLLCLICALCDNLRQPLLLFLFVFFALIRGQI